MSVYSIDLDNTICRTRGTDYQNAVPIKKAVRLVNELYDKGHTICIFTGRGSSSGLDWKDLTLRQLVKWGVKFHSLIMGKPPYDIFIDDHAINAKDWLNGKTEL